LGIGPNPQSPIPNDITVNKILYSLYSLFSLFSD